MKTEEFIQWLKDTRAEMAAHPLSAGESSDD
jgi:hypothetical protein